MIAKLYNLDPTELELLLDAITLSGIGRKEWIRLAGMILQSPAPLNGLVEINFLQGKITDVHYHLTGKSLERMVARSRP